MLIEAGLPKKFWGEAATTAAYLINKCPSSAIKFETPYGKWYGRPVKYDHLRVFGSKAYAHINQDKLEPRAIKCFMLGYPSGTKGYKLWCIEPGKGKVIVSRDLLFDES